MASIHKRRGKYQVRWRDRAGQQRARGAPDHATAKRIARAIEQALAEGRDWAPPRPGAVPGLEVMLADVIRARSLSCSPGHVKNLTLAGGQLLTMIEGRLGRPARAEDLSQQVLIDLHTWLTQAHPTDHNPTTRRQHRVVCNPRTATARVQLVRSLWASLHAHEEHGGHVPAPPPRIEGLPAAEAPLQAAPTWAEMDAAITAEVPLLPAWYQEQLLTLARFTGLRASQLMALRWEWVDLEAGMLWVHPSIGKSRQERRGRRVPLSPHLVSRMAGWGRREGFVVDTGTPGRTVRRQSLYRCWEASGARREAWAPSVGSRGQPLHAYRHGLATGLLLEGAPEYLVARLLGQAARTVTVARYADQDTLLLPRLREVVALIPDIGAAAGVVPLVFPADNGGRR